MVFRPVPDATRRQGLAAALGLAFITLLCGVALVRRSPDGWSVLFLVGLVVSLFLLARIAYRTWGAFNLEYWLDRNALRVRWAASCQVIPLTSIRRLILPDEVARRVEDGSTVLGTEGQAEDRRPGAFTEALAALEPGGTFQWPSPFVRPERRLNADGFASLATRPLPACLLLDTDVGLFALSPADRDGFIAALQEHRRLGPSQVTAARWEEPFPCWTALRADRLGQVLLLAGLFGVLALFAVLMLRFPSLPDRLAFHFDRFGAPDSIRPKGALFLLPTIGLFAYLVNGGAGVWMACRAQRAGAYLLWIGALMVHVFTFLALFNLIA